MDIRKVKKLIELLEESGIAEIEITEGDDAVRISRYPAGGVAGGLGVVARGPHERRVASAVKRVLAGGRFPLVLGGEHSLTAGAIRPFARRHDDLAEAIRRPGTSDP